MPLNSARWDNDRPVDVRLFAVSRQMRDEAERLFYAENAMRVCVNQPWEMETDPIKLPLWVRLELPVAKDIKRVHVSFVRGDSEELIPIQSCLESVAGVLKRCQHLTVVRFTILGCYPQREEPDMMINMILDSFLSQCGFGNVLYSGDGPVWILYSTTIFMVRRQTPKLSESK